LPPRTLDESDSKFAIEMKQEIARQLKACRTNSQIIDSMVAQFGLRASRRRRRTASI